MNPLNNFVTKWKYKEDPPRQPKAHQPAHPKKPKVPRTLYHFPLSSFTINTSDKNKADEKTKEGEGEGRIGDGKTEESGIVESNKDEVVEVIRKGVSEDNECEDKDAGVSSNNNDNDNDNDNDNNKKRKVKNSQKSRKPRPSVYNKRKTENRDKALADLVDKVVGNIQNSNNSNDNSDCRAQQSKRGKKEGENSIENLEGNNRKNNYTDMLLLLHPQNTTTDNIDDNVSLTSYKESVGNNDSPIAISHQDVDNINNYDVNNIRWQVYVNNHNNNSHCNDNNYNITSDPLLYFKTASTTQTNSPPIMLPVPIYKFTSNHGHHY